MSFFTDFEILDKSEEKKTQKIQYPAAYSHIKYSDKKQRIIDTESDILSSGRVLFP